MSGAPCFAGTRVPVKNLFDYLEGGDTLGEFLDGLPGVTRDHALPYWKCSARNSLGD